MIDDCESFGVVVADNDASVRAALSDLIDSHPRLRLLGEAVDGLEAAELCGCVLPHVAVIDVRMPHGGVEATLSILEASPTTQVVAFTTVADRATREQLVDAGAAAVFSKSGGANLAEEIVRIACGQ